MPLNLRVYEYIVPAETKPRQDQTKCCTNIIDIRDQKTKETITKLQGNILKLNLEKKEKKFCWYKKWKGSFQHKVKVQYLVYKLINNKKGKNWKNINLIYNNEKKKDF